VSYGYTSPPVLRSVATYRLSGYCQVCVCAAMYMTALYGVEVVGFDVC